jgi:hypothetical protein
MASDPETLRVCQMASDLILDKAIFQENNQFTELSDISCNLALTSLRKLYNDSFSDLSTLGICAEYPSNKLGDDLHFCPINLLDPVTNVSQANDLTNNILQANDIILEITETDK